MVAHAQRVVNGFLFPLVLGVLLLSAAVVLATPTYPSSPPGTVQEGYRCDRQCGPPGQAGNCTYPYMQCNAVGADLAGAANGKPYFQTTHYRQWGKCKYTASLPPVSTCEEWPTFICAEISFYNNRVGGVCQQFTHSVWVNVGPNICNPDPTMAGNMIPCAGEETTDTVGVP